jgi:hypothetical protein
MDDRQLIEHTNRRYRHLAPRAGGGAGRRSDALAPDRHHDR